MNREIEQAILTVRLPVLQGTDRKISVVFYKSTSRVFMW